MKRNMVEKRLNTKLSKILDKLLVFMFWLLLFLSFPFVSTACLVFPLCSVGPKLLSRWWHFN